MCPKIEKSNRGTKKRHRVAKEIIRRHFQIRLRVGCDFLYLFIYFTARRYCLPGTGRRGGGGNGVNRIQLDMATAALWEAFQQRLVQDVIPSDFTARDEHLQSIT